MRTDRIGDILSRIIPLSGHDIEEILQEQRYSHRPFGDIALSMGLCQPSDIWQAWSGQLDGPDGGIKQIDLDAFGVDSQAVDLMSADDARRWTAIPVRVFGDALVVAVDAAELSRARQNVRARPGLQLKLVACPRNQIVRAIERYYEMESLTAA